MAEMSPTARRRQTKRPENTPGRKPLYPGKVQPPMTMSLTALGRRILKDTRRRTKYSIGDIVEHLLRRHAADLTDNEVATEVGQ